MSSISLPANQAPAWLDSTGLHIPEYAAVLADTQNMFRAIYGEDVNLDADTQDGALCAVLALRRHDTNQLLLSVYNSFFPSTAQGTSLSSVVKVNGITRHNYNYSQVDVRLVGQIGTVIEGGVAGDERDHNWLLPARVVIPQTGEIMVTARAEEPGAITAAPGEINRIVRGGVRGWQSISNPAAALPGQAVEQDYQLRARQRISTALPSRTVFEGTRGAVAALPGVTRHQAYENDTSETDANGVPPHSICVVVEGGDSAAIAQAISDKKTPGCGTYGNIAVRVTDKYGVPGLIKFYRSTNTPLQLAVKIKPLRDYLASTGEAMRQNLFNHINCLDIGEDVLISELYCPVNNARPAGAGRTFDVLEILIGPQGGGVESLAQQNVNIAFNAAAAIALQDITVEIVA